MKDSLIFYSKSPDKPPGKYKGEGWSEYVNDKNKYKSLSEIPDWRKKLSNMYVSEFKLDEQTWCSVEHFFHACKYRDKYNDYYKTFTVNGGKQWSQDPFKSKQAGKAGRLSKAGKVYTNSKMGVPTNVKMREDFYDRNIHLVAMTLALLSKFTQSSDLLILLLETKDAELYHLVTERGKKSTLQRWDHLEKIRYCIKKYNISILSDIHIELVDKILK
jgi:predicted NAD-dependent protein-ADP-ribosyltransferase YbiA (DUF1768 family)